MVVSRSEGPVMSHAAHAEESLRRPERNCVSPQRLRDAGTKQREYGCVPLCASVSCRVQYSCGRQRAVSVIEIRAKRSQLGRVAGWKWQVAREETPLRRHSRLRGLPRAKQSQFRRSGGHRVSRDLGPESPCTNEPNSASADGAPQRDPWRWGTHARPTWGSSCETKPIPGAPAASAFALREETPCGVTTNTAVSRQTKPIGAKRSRGRATGLSLFSASFVSFGYPQFGCDRTSARREPPGTYGEHSCQTKPISESFKLEGAGFKQAKARGESSGASHPAKKRLAASLRTRLCRAKRSQFYRKYLSIEALHEDRREDSGFAPLVLPTDRICCRRLSLDRRSGPSPEPDSWFFACPRAGVRYNRGGSRARASTWRRRRLLSTRRGVRVADRAGFENQCAVYRTAGSNPALSVCLTRHRVRPAVAEAGSPCRFSLSDKSIMTRRKAAHPRRSGGKTNPPAPRTSLDPCPFGSRRAGSPQG